MKSKLVEISLATLIGIIITGAGAWMVFGQDKVTRSEMIDYVQNQAPWTKARGEIQSAIKLNNDSITALEKVVEKLVTSQQALIVEQRVLVTKFDQYVESTKKD